MFWQSCDQFNLFLFYCHKRVCFLELSWVTVMMLSQVSGQVFGWCERLQLGEKRIHGSPVVHVAHSTWLFRCWPRAFVGFTYSLAFDLKESKFSTFTDCWLRKGLKQCLFSFKGLTLTWYAFNLYKISRLEDEASLQPAIPPNLQWQYLKTSFLCSALDQATGAFSHSILTHRVFR